MSQTSPTPITAAPPAPQRGNRSTFSTLLDAFLTWLVNVVAQFNALATNVYNNAVDAYNNASAASGSAQAAAISADAAASGASVSAWVSGTSYTVGQCRYSPIDFKTYRRKTAGAGATDPSLDSANWTLVSQEQFHYKLLASVVVSAGASAIDFLNVFSSAYDEYEVMIKGVKGQADAALQVRFAVAGAVDSSLSYWGQDSSFGAGTWGSRSGQLFQVGGQPIIASDGQFDAVMLLTDVNRTVAKGIFARCVHLSPSNNAVFADSRCGQYNGTSSTSGFRLFLSGGATFAAGGIVKVYGIKNT